MSKSEYLKLADAITAEIADGTLKPGDRLPPQRNFAYERKIAVSTAGRVYTELLRRGLVVGEVGGAPSSRAMPSAARQRQASRAASGSTSSSITLCFPTKRRSSQKAWMGWRNLRHSMPH